MRILFLIFFVYLGHHAKAARRDIVAELFEDDHFRKEVGYGEDKLSTVLVGGSIVCDHACYDENSSLQSQPITGASLAVICDTSKKTSKSDWIKGTADEYGDFLIDLPSHLHAIQNIENKCIVKILEVPKTSPCNQALTGEHRRIKFSSTDNGFRIYTAHEIHLIPKDLQPCLKKQVTF
ncbi:uncharacterized protein [Rutidosis leptorrhynchoides]|uniref:uncharacterized protein n=1 Tax=Rutidosis leptorrhynchoides TaxID=125765 RepID=UPI003A991381